MKSPFVAILIACLSASASSFAVSAKLSSMKHAREEFQQAPRPAFPGVESISGDDQEAKSDRRPPVSATHDAIQRLREIAKMQER
mmetsp:Transcript_19967/g.29582  ORF Transcript_19967/g.29582 Transcript_19967/m.29582 type:complete len:85 (-) Transcript_19967:210-464(-)